ncbi:hypothetical protein MASR1M46_06730 [Bacteroidales bacterium]
MKNLLKWAVLAAISQVLSISCISSKDDSFTHLPFRQSENGLWGMLSADGKAIISDEYSSPPFAATEGIYIVKKENGLFEYYKAEPKPVRIGSQYFKAAAFRESLAPVMEDEEIISVINSKGDVLFKLEKVSGKRITSCSLFSDGLALIQNEDGLFGFVDSKGNIAITPQYSEAFSFSEGVAIVRTDDGERSKWIVINKKGEELLKLDDETTETTGKFSGGLLGILKSADDGAWGFISKNNEELIKPSREFISVTAPKFKKFTYFDGTKWGISDITGNRIIPAEYDNILHSGNGYFIVKKGDVWFVIDSENRESSNVDFTEHTGNNHGYIFAKVRDKFILLDSKGKRVGDQEYFEVNSNFPPSVVSFGAQNFKRDIAELFQVIAPGKLWKFSIGAPASQVAELLGSGNAETLKSSRTLSTKRSITDIESSISLGFSSEMGIAVTERVMLRDMWGKAYWDNVIKGYVFNENSYLQDISTNIKIFGKLAGKEREVANSILGIAKASGFSIQSQEEGIITLIAGNTRILNIKYAQNAGLNLLLR